MGLGLSDRRFRVLEMVGGGEKFIGTSERVRGGGATVKPPSSSVRSALEVARLALKHNIVITKPFTSLDDLEDWRLCLLLSSLHSFF